MSLIAVTIKYKLPHHNSIMMTEKFGNNLDHKIGKEIICKKIKSIIFWRDEFLSSFSSQSLSSFSVDVSGKLNGPVG